MSIIPGLGMVPAFMAGAGNARPAGTVFLCHCDGTNGSTTFVDEIGKTITAVGNAQITTTTPKFGTGAYLGDGSGDYIYAAASSDFVFGTGDFTVAFWIKTNDDLSSKWLAGASIANDTDAGTWAVLPISNVDLRLYLGGSGFIVSGAVTDLGNNAWRHIAITRSGNSVRLFLDGAQVGSTYNASGLSFGPSGRPIAFGGSSGGSVNGRFDELLVVKGAAVWTANFTPPVEPYT